MTDDIDEINKKNRYIKSTRFKSYEIGYAKPPVEHRFEKGQSGNPKGRPKGVPQKRPLNDARLQEIILNESYREIKLNENGQTITLPMAEAIVRSIAVNAAKGHVRSQKLFTDLLGKVEADRLKLHNEYLQTMIEYKVRFTHEIERCKRLGVPPPDPLPHPDHIVIDMNTGQGLITGPITPEEKRQWDYLEQRKKEAIERIIALRKQQSEEAGPLSRQQIEVEIAAEWQKLMELFPNIDK